MTVTLNVRVDSFIRANSAGPPVPGSKVLNYSVGFNPDKVRVKIDSQHSASIEFERPPPATNPNVERTKRVRKEKRQQIEQIREVFEPKSMGLLEKAEKWFDG